MCTAGQFGHPNDKMVRHVRHKLFCRLVTERSDQPTIVSSPSSTTKCPTLSYGPTRADLHVVGMLRFMSDMNQPSLPTPFHSVLVSISVFMALLTVFHSINSPDNSSFSDCSSGLISAFFVVLTTYLFMKVSFSPDSPDVNPLWLTGLKAATN